MAACPTPSRSSREALAASWVERARAALAAGAHTRTLLVGHVPHLERHRLASLPRPPLYIGTLREPVGRVISSFYFGRLSPGVIVKTRAERFREVRGVRRRGNYAPQMKLPCAI